LDSHLGQARGSHRIERRASTTAANVQAAITMRGDVDRQAMIDMLWGSIYYRLLLHTRPLEPEQIDAALDIAFEGLRG
jgi:Tetracyclin repressor-like, C-terminal domain